MRNLFRSGTARLLTLFLLAQAAALYSSMYPEVVPPGRPLAEFPTSLGPWNLTQEGVVDEESRAALKADDLMSREYRSAKGDSSGLFVAAYQSQRTGKAPHSPKNCLPGNGWARVSAGEISIDVGQPQPIVVNRYVVTHGAARSVVLYWYQSRDRVVADELKAKIWVILDSIRLHRTDTALVRVTIPVNQDDATADRTAVAFIQAFYPHLRNFLPA